MKYYIALASIILVFTNCNNSKKMQTTFTSINLFKEIITGDFDNATQLADEIKAGKQIHPLAKHVNRVADNKIKNLPKDDNSFFILEESYYIYPGKPMDVKPYLFKFTGLENNTVLLSVYQLPKEIDKKDIRNDNEKLFFDYNELTTSTTFKGATYEFNELKKTFNTTSINDLGNGLTFTLTETLSKNKLIVMELLEKEGKKLTPYDTPIVYDRK
jgi:hypothetical protein